MLKFSKKCTYLLAIAMLISCNSTGGQSVEETAGIEIEISGMVNYPQSGGIVLLEEILATGQLGDRDTIALSENYTYSFRKKMTTPGIYRLNFYGLQFVNILLDDENIQVNVDGNNRNGFVQISGSTDHKLLDEFQLFNADFQRSEEMQKLNAAFQQAQQQVDTKEIDALRAKYVEMETIHNAAASE